MLPIRSVESFSLWYGWTALCYFAGRNSKESLCSERFTSPKEKSHTVRTCTRVCQDANSRYVLTVSNSRPETYQQHEAIAFGSKPVTSLDSILHRHLEGNAIFEEETWNLMQMEEKLPDYPAVNRRLAFEEYWMEYIEREVNHRIRWLDPSINERSSLADITDRVMKIADIHHHENNVTTSKSVHNPTYFQDKVPLDKLIKRGNLLRVYTGCSIATWSYSGFTEEDDHRLEDCYLDKGLEALLMHQVTNETASQVKAYDTVCVPIASLERFIANVLPKIQNDFFLMTGQKSLLSPFSKHLFDTVIDHQDHEKMGIFPYGIFTQYPEQYLEIMAKDVKKKNFIYVGYLNKGTNKKVRRDIHSAIARQDSAANLLCWNSQ